MITTPLHPSVFVCYAKDQDSQLARELAAALRLLGFAVRRDVEDLEPGDRWSERIDDLVRECAVFLALLSHDAISSDECRREWTLAERERKKILAVRTQDIDEDQIPSLFAPGQRIEYVGTSRSFADLLRTVADELRRDAAWFREQNYLAALERDWRAQSNEIRPLYLLSKRQAERAREALRARGSGLPEPTVAVLDFIAASEAEHRKRHRTVLLLALVAPGLLFGLVAVSAFWFSVDEKSQNVDARVAAPLDPEPAASSPSLLLPVEPRPAVSPSAEDVKRWTQQFSSVDRRLASDMLQRAYLESASDPEGRQRIIDATIEALQPKGRGSYRVNLYVFVTLGRLPGWTWNPPQREKVKEAAVMHEQDPTYSRWAARALQTASPPIR